MREIRINECVYKVHPIYNLYAGSKDGKIINIIKQVPHIGSENNGGYLGLNVRKHGQSGFKNYRVHRFIWECYNGIIPEDKEMDHINNKRNDNRLCNLQLLTHQRNCEKKVYKNSYERRRCVKATCLKTGEISFYFSLYATEQHLKINSPLIKKICEKCNYHKSGLSKKDGFSYTFEYIKEEDLPDNYIKSKNIKPKRVSQEEKKKKQMEWQNKEYKCPKCNKIIKNFSKYKHNEKCLTK